MTDSFGSYKMFFLGLGIGFTASVFFTLWNRIDSPKRSKPEKKSSKSPKTKTKRITDDCKMVLVVRKDLKNKQETTIHCVHACFGAFEEALVLNPELVKHWKWNGSAKIALKVNSEEELLTIKQLADEYKLANHLIRDADPTKNKGLVLAVGPDRIKDIDAITGHLKLY